MGRGKYLDVFKRDTLLLNWIREHKGIENLVSINEIHSFLSDNGYSIGKNGIYSAIDRIMYERNAPICFENGKGFYWATKREELEKTISDLESRRNSLQEHIDHLKGFMI